MVVLVTMFTAFPASRQKEKKRQPSSPQYVETKKKSARLRWILSVEMTSPDARTHFLLNKSSQSKIKQVRLSWDYFYTKSSLGNIKMWHPNNSTAKTNKTQNAPNSIQSLLLDYVMYDFDD